MKEDLSFIKKHIKKNQKLLSLDVSKNNIGIAISDINLSLAFPFFQISRTKFEKDIKTIKTFIEKENVFALIIGMPLDGDGSLNERTQSIKDFTKKLQEFIDIYIFFQDERFSTYAIENNFFNKKSKNKDEKAAAWFLQIFLDKLKNASYP